MISQRQSPSSRPARGTRPPNRRQLIIDAAAGLLCDAGFGNVSMSDVAAAVAVGPSALYRHFRSKQALLATVIEDALGTLDQALKAADASADVAAVLANVVLDRRTVGVLWRREARHLSAPDRTRLRRLARRIGDRLAQHIQHRRPELESVQVELLAWCALGIANTVSFHHFSMPEPGFSSLLTKLIAVPLGARAELREVNSAGPQRSSAAFSRREAILSASADLFAQRGFSGVSVDDIGAAVGIAGPSIYTYFGSKTDILTAVMFRGNERLWTEFHRAVADARDADQALNGVVRSYQSFAFQNPDAVELLITEVANLPLPDGQSARSAQRAYIDEWVHLARQLHPGQTVTEARIRVQAAQIMINDVAVMPRLRDLPGVDAVLTDIAIGLLVAASGC
ncbi:TetR/AcrR family transcriptional regulator [Mycobacterium genavense]|uniref:TetR/AcrR family transcriptional regulator n=1 Tax=Mycobacterium genavense TaxID=36812 RepID=UPI0004719B89|nr:TetR/AcrR family transcriptional regulator [Mycobacterium genavense]